MKEWLTALEIAELKLENLPGTERSIRRIADKEHWESRPREGRGGRARVSHSQPAAGRAYRVGAEDRAKYGRRSCL